MVRYEGPDMATAKKQLTNGGLSTKENGQARVTAEGWRRQERESSSSAKRSRVSKSR